MQSSHWILQWSPARQLVTALAVSRVVYSGAAILQAPLITPGAGWLATYIHSKNLSGPIYSKIASSNCYTKGKHTEFNMEPIEKISF